MARSGGARALESHRVLLVEDTGDTRDLLEILLRADGADVRAAGTVRDALGLAAGWDFDVLLTDLGLPDASGDILIREISRMKTRSPRVIVMTGFGEPHQRRAWAAGAHAVFTKPLDWLRLRKAMTVGDESLAA
jgi:CheY-like chemotaxis protein